MFLHIYGSWLLNFFVKKKLQDNKDENLHKMRKICIFF